MILIPLITDDAEPFPHGGHPDTEQRIRQQGTGERKEVPVEYRDASGTRPVHVALYIMFHCRERERCRGYCVGRPGVGRK